MHYVLSPSGEKILTILRSGNAALRNLGNPSEPVSTLALGSDFSDIAFSPDGKQMLGAFGAFDPLAEIRQTDGVGSPIRLTQSAFRVTGRI